MPRTSAFLVLVLVAIPGLVLAQSQPTSDPTALAFASQSIMAMTGGNPVSDVTLTGNSTWIAGSDNETGAATLYAKGTESRIDLNLTGGTRTDIRNDFGTYPQGTSVVGSGTQQTWALHNCWINASWFFPALSVLAATSDPTVILKYVGQETRNGTLVQHIQSFRYISATRPIITTVTQSVSTMDIYLDAGSLLPIAFVFNVHADDDAATNIGVEIDFSNYQAVNGIQVPFHVQKLISNGLALDLVVSSAVFNSGLSDSLFAVQ